MQAGRTDLESVVTIRPLDEVRQELEERGLTGMSVEDIVDQLCKPASVRTEDAREL